VALPVYVIDAEVIVADVVVVFDGEIVTA